MSVRHLYSYLRIKPSHTGKSQKLRQIPKSPCVHASYGLSLDDDCWAALMLLWVTPTYQQLQTVAKKKKKRQNSKLSISAEYFSFCQEYQASGCHFKISKFCRFEGHDGWASGQKQLEGFARSSQGYHVKEVVRELINL